MARKQPLRDWAIEEFGAEYVPSYPTLIAYAKNQMISPPPQKVGRRWMVEKTARFVGIGTVPKSKANDDPLLTRILNDGQTA